MGRSLDPIGTKVVRTMLVCLCNGLNEAAVRSAARTCGSTKPKDVYSALGATVECGCCLGFAKAVIDAELAPHDPHAVAAE